MEAYLPQNWNSAQTIICWRSHRGRHGDLPNAQHLWLPASHDQPLSRRTKWLTLAPNVKELAWKTGNTCCSRTTASSPANMTQNWFSIEMVERSATSISPPLFRTCARHAKPPRHDAACRLLPFADQPYEQARRSVTLFSATFSGAPLPPSSLIGETTTRKHHYLSIVAPEDHRKPITPHPRSAPTI